MQIHDVHTLSSMPLSGPSYKHPPFRFVDREYLIITYKTDPECLRRAVPEPLQPDPSHTVLYEFIRMPNSYGFGSYTESGIVIPCVFEGEAVNFTSQMYLDCDAPIVAGREIWGFPKKYALPRLEVIQDTLTGTLSYAGHQVAFGTMAFKTEDVWCGGAHEEALRTKMSKTQVNLKVIPHASGRGYDALQLVAYQLQDITLKGAWTGEARLHLIPHVNAPVADLPVQEVVGGFHCVADLTLPEGRVLFDYLKNTP